MLEAVLHQQQKLLEKVLRTQLKQLPPPLKQQH
jgi:hypothetical protein